MAAPPNHDPVHRTVLRGAWGIAAFWLLLLGLLFLGFDHLEQRRTAARDRRDGAVTSTSTSTTNATQLR